MGPLLNKQLAKPTRAPQNTLIQKNLWISCGMFSGCVGTKLVEPMMLATGTASGFVNLLQKTT